MMNLAEALSTKCMAAMNKYPRDFFANVILISTKKAVM
jgi:hypothetical protein